ncbi:MAG: hypothetical protein QOF48_1956 [Verrucomicrobiota bacterium]|jgi:hypothetical protein
MKMSTLGKPQAGNIRILFALVIAMGAAFWYGGQGVYTSLRNRRPVQLGMADLVHGRPSAHWLVLTNAELAIYDAAWKIRRSKYEPASGGHITEGYIPLRAPGQSLSDRCFAVLATTDPSTLALLEELRNVKDETGMAKFVVNHKSELKQQRQVSGLVRFGIQSGNEAGKLGGLQKNLAPNFIVLADGGKPNLTQSVGLLLVGFLIAGGLGMVAVNRSRTGASAT